MNWRLAIWYMLVSVRNWQRWAWFLFVFAIAVMCGFWVGWIAGYNAVRATTPPPGLVDDPRYNLSYYHTLMMAAPKLSPDQAELRCNYEGLVAYRIGMWRDLDVSLDTARERIASMHKDFETNNESMSDMIYMGLVAQQVYMMTHLEPIDLSIGYYNACRRRLQQPPDMQL